MKCLHSTVVSACIVLIVAATGCGSGVKRPSRMPLTPAESIDPFAYGDEFARPGADVSISAPGEIQDISQEQNPDGPALQEPLSRTDGRTLPLADGIVYRVQLGGVFENRDEADSYARRARNRLDDEITVEYRAPFYRVYAGSFHTQRDAEAYILLLREQGFRDSRWVTERLTAQ